jgi:hypothetical protein
MDIDFSALASRVAARADVLGCVILSRDGLVMGAFPPNGERDVTPAWLRFSSVGEPERGFVEFPDEMWAYVRLGPYAAFAVGSPRTRAGVLLDYLEQALLVAEDARELRAAVRRPETVDLNRERFGIVLPVGSRPDAAPQLAAHPTVGAAPDIHPAPPEAHTAPPEVHTGPSEVPMAPPDVVPTAAPEHQTAHFDVPAAHFDVPTAHLDAPDPVAPPAMPPPLPRQLPIQPPVESRPPQAPEPDGLWARFTSALRPPSEPVPQTPTPVEPEPAEAAGHPDEIDRVALAREFAELLQDPPFGVEEGR